MCGLYCSTERAGRESDIENSYFPLSDKVRTVDFYIREKQKTENRLVVTGELEFANVRLSLGDENDNVVVAKRP